MRFKALLYGILFILLIGVGGLVYRNAMERAEGPVACTADAKVCPDGTALGRTGPSCTFPACAPPNVTLAEAGIAYAVPDGFAAAPLPDAASVAAYRSGTTTESATIVIRRYAVGSSTPLAIIRETAIGGASGLPVPATSFTSRSIGSYRFTVVSIERFEATVHTAFYLSRGNDVFRFDAVDQGVANWTDPRLDLGTLPAHRALTRLLETLQGA